MTGWLGPWTNDFGRNSASCRLKSMMERAAWSTLSEVKASDFWASTSATSAVGHSHIARRGRDRAGITDAFEQLRLAGANASAGPENDADPDPRHPCTMPCARVQDRGVFRDLPQDDVKRIM